jgi:hypothetical protein
VDTLGIDESSRNPELDRTTKAALSGVFDAIDASTLTSSSLFSCPLAPLSLIDYEAMELDEIKIANEVVIRFRTEGEILIRNLKMFINREFPHDLPQTSESPFSFLVHYHGLPLIFRIEIIIANKRVAGRVKAIKWDIVDRSEKDILEYEFDGYGNVGSKTRKLARDTFCGPFLQDMFTVLFESGEVHLRPG